MPANLRNSLFILAITYDTHDITIHGNIIGADLSGTVAVPNGEGGRIATSKAVITDNLISGNTGNGISLLGASKAVIRNNTIGANREGTAALANDGDGIWCYAGAADNTIMGDLISGNTARAIAIVGATSHGFVIQGNTIGANRSGTATSLADRAPAKETSSRADPALVEVV